MLNSPIDRVMNSSTSLLVILGLLGVAPGIGAAEVALSKAEVPEARETLILSTDLDSLSASLRSEMHADIADRLRTEIAVAFESAVPPAVLQAGNIEVQSVRSGLLAAQKMSVSPADVESLGATLRSDMHADIADRLQSEIVLAFDPAVRSALLSDTRDVVVANAEMAAGQDL